MSYYKYLNYFDAYYERFNNYIWSFIFSVIGFFLPFLLGHPQYLVGSIVNMLLITSAFTQDLKRFWPIIFLPSLGVLTRGILFGPFTYILLYFLPIIWISNFILIATIKFFNHKIKENSKKIKANSKQTKEFRTKIFGLSLAIILKVLILSLYSFILFSLSLIPSKIVLAMSLVQLITASIGAILSISFLRGYNIIQQLLINNER